MLTLKVSEDGKSLDVYDGSDRIDDTRLSRLCFFANELLESIDLFQRQGQSRLENSSGDPDSEVDPKKSP